MKITISRTANPRRLMHHGRLQEFDVEIDRHQTNISCTRDYLLSSQPVAVSWYGTIQYRGEASILGSPTNSMFLSSANRETGAAATTHRSDSPPERGAPFSPALARRYNFKSDERSGVSECPQYVFLIML